MTEIDPGDLEPDEHPDPVTVLEGERDVEASEADAAEQLAEVTGSDASADPDLEDSVEADPADRAEQRRVVELGDDEYR